MRTIREAAFAAGIALFCCGAHAADPAPIRVALAIEQQPLRTALASLADQTGLQIMRRDEDASADGLMAPRLVGEMSPKEALDKLLANSGLTYQFLNERTVRVSKVADAATSPDAPPKGKEGKIEEGKRPLALAQSRPRAKEAVAEAPSSARNSATAPPARAALQEVVITGTHTADPPAGSPRIVLDNHAILTSGYASTSDLVNSLPQNFAGGLNGNTVISPNPDSKQNVGSRSSVNLRGLGASSTLVLLNGHRLTPAGTRAAVDVGAIPLSAIDRVEIVADGASAVYGSDAVGGVVNFVLKRNLEGGETLLQYGGATSGGVQERRGAQTVGTSWGSGGALASIEYYDHDPLLARDRSFANAVPPAQYLTPGRIQRSFVGHVDQSLGSRFSIFVDALASNQTSDYANLVFSSLSHDRIRALSLTSGATAALQSGWKIALTGVYGYDKDEQASYDFRTNQWSATPTNWDTHGYSGELTANGSVANLPSGPLSVAVGVGDRHEEFEAVAQKVSPVSRNITHAFGELQIPLSGNEATPLLRNARVNIAGRYEHYDDAGGAIDPKIGVAVSPTDRLSIRGTWGKSFRAPALFEKHGPVNAFVIRLPDPSSPTGSTLSVAAIGSNPSLQPERAKTWTLGTDLTFPTENSRVSLTYFNTRYNDRIGQVQASFAKFLVNENLHPSVIQRNPGAPLIANFLASANQVFGLPPGFDPASVGAFVQAASVNASLSSVRGIDLLFSYEQPVKDGRLTWTFNSTYLLHSTIQVTPQTPDIDTYDRIFYPTAMKIRAGAAWDRHGFGASLTFNYTDSYTNDTVTPAQRVGSYMPLDLQLRYFSDQPSGPLAGLRVSLTALNLLDRSPPRVASPLFLGGAQFGFDPANANPLGRVVTLQVSKAF